MKITRPLRHITPIDPQRDIPCWFFENLEIEDYDYDSIVWDGIKGKNILTNTDNFSKRQVATHGDNSQTEVFQGLTVVLRKLVLEIKNNHPLRGVEISWPADTWSDRFFENEHYNIPFDLKRDSKGFHMGKHLDNRNTKWTLIMNLKDHISSTVIHTNQGDISIPSKKGSGVFYFNHEEMYHSIGPIEDEDRITLFWMNMVT
jgi:hypothetical protein